MGSWEGLLKEQSLSQHALQTFSCSGMQGRGGRGRKLIWNLKTQPTGHGRGVDGKKLPELSRCGVSGFRFWETLKVLGRGTIFLPMPPIP